MNFDWVRGLGGAADFMSQFLMQKKLLDEEQKRHEEQSGRQKQDQALRILQAVLSLAKGGTNIELGKQFESLQGLGLGQQQKTLNVPMQTISPEGIKTPFPEKQLTVPTQGEYIYKPKEPTREEQLGWKAQETFTLEDARLKAKNLNKEPPSEDEKVKAEINKVRLEKEKIQVKIANLNEQYKRNQLNKPEKDLTGQHRAKLLAEARRLIQLEKYEQMIQNTDLSKDTEGKELTKLLKADPNKIPITPEELNAKVNELMGITHGSSNQPTQGLTPVDEQALYNKYQQFGWFRLTKEEQDYIKRKQGK